MKGKRLVAPELLLEGETDTIQEALEHPRMVDGFTHWSSPGWDEENQSSVVILTYDPQCPRCRYILFPEEKEVKG